MSYSDPSPDVEGTNKPNSNPPDTASGGEPEAPTNPAEPGEADSPE